MEQKIRGKLFKKCEIESGNSKNGYGWSRQTIVISAEDSTKIAISLFNTELYEVEKFNEGDDVEVTYLFGATEHGGRWYNNTTFVSMKHTDEVVVVEKKPLDFQDWLDM